jgi:hypothetical protein
VTTALHHSSSAPITPLTSRRQRWTKKRAPVHVLTVIFLGEKDSTNDKSLPPSSPQGVNSVPGLDHLNRIAPKLAQVFSIFLRYLKAFEPRANLHSAHVFDQYIDARVMLIRLPTSEQKKPMAYFVAEYREFPVGFE